jgi:CheY-like chemotaxis protein
MSVDAVEGVPTLVGRRVLILEDQSVIALDLECIVEGLGAKVAGPLASVAKALAAIRGERLDAALLDVRLGDGMGYTVADALAEQGVPYAFVTGTSTGERLAEPHAGAPRIGKPFTEEDVRAVLLALLSTRSSG